MRRTKACGILAAALLAISFAMGRAPGAEKISADRLLPPDVYLLIEVPSVPEFKARLSKTRTGQLINEPALADFWKDVEAQVEKLSEQAEQKVGVSVKSMLAIPSGQVSIAVLRVASGELGMVAVLDYGENASTVDKLLAKANEKLLEQGAEKKEEDVDGTKLVIHTMTDKNEDGDAATIEPGGGGGTPENAAKAETHTLVWFTRDNHLVVSTGVEIAKSVLARWDGKHSSTFADSDTHRYIRTRCKTSNSEPAINWYLDPVGLLQAAIETGGGGLEGQMVMMYLPKVGISELKALGGSLDMAAGEFDTVSRTCIYVEGEQQGLLNVFHFPEAELSPPKWVTAGVASYATYNWDVLRAYSAVEQLVDGFAGPGTLIRFIEQMSQNPGGIHLKKDFLDHLTGRVHLVTAAPKDEKAVAAQPVPRMMFAFDAKNADKLKTTLDNVSGNADLKAKTRDFSGTTIYELESAPGATGATSAAVVDNALMVATDVSMLEQVIRADGDQQPLAESPDFRRIASHYPSKTSGLSYEKQDAQVEMVYEMLRTGTAPFLPIEGLDFSKLPAFSEIKKYLSPTGSFAIPDARGAYYETFTLPKSEN